MYDTLDVEMTDTRDISRLYLFENGEGGAGFLL